eukprot:5620961-Pleurochrysis_carterae.AAC.1
MVAKRVQLNNRHFHKSSKGDRTLRLRRNAATENGKAKSVFSNAVRRVRRRRVVALELRDVLGHVRREVRECQLRHD